MADSNQSHATAASVTDDQVRDILKEMLKEIDISSTSMREIRRILQEKIGEGFNVDERKDFVKEIVESFLMEDNNDDPDEPEEDQDEDMREENAVGDNSKEEPNKKKGGGGFAKPLMLSEELAEFMGGKIASRTEVTKKIWEYIKANNLQNPANRREILCDEKFEKLMKRKKINMFKMTQVLNPMMKRLQDLQASCLSDDDDDSDDADNSKSNKKAAGQKRKLSATVSVKKEKKTAKSKNTDDNSDDDDDDDAHDKKRPKALPKKKKAAAISSSSAGPSIRSDPLQAHMKKKPSSSSSLYVHPELLSALGVTEIDTRPQLVKKLWEYIKGHNLQNPADKREILLDEPLKKVFKINKFTAFSMNRYLNNVVKKE